ncbi:hypothetical protein ACF059_30910 [Streptomyces sp. NPDC016562]|uniref:hypothetical protein n=1 Tax=Streptomyces sp. NPDC016562 TaxID=3364966 RepID=UPI0036F89C64
MPSPHELRHLGAIDAHVQFYDDPELIDWAAAEIIDWHLMTEAGQLLRRDREAVRARSGDVASGATEHALDAGRSGGPVPRTSTR